MRGGRARFFSHPRPAETPAHLDSFAPEADPEPVIFFCRPEALRGLHQLAAFVTNDPEGVASPWSAGCGSLAVWPLRYLAKGRQKAVIGGWDPSARKFYKTDELSFTVPGEMFVQMLARQESGFSAPRPGRSSGKRLRGAKRPGAKPRPGEVAGRDVRLLGPGETTGE